MNKSLRLGFAMCVLVGCGDDPATTPDTQTGNHPPPRIISGGGIGDGAIDGVVNLYVIDDATDTPLANATVRVGGVDGTTDGTGLFVANGVVGPQTVIAKLAGYQSLVWLGADGANMTMAMKAAADPVPSQANLSGSISGWDTITPAAGHRKAAIISYSNDDKAADAANNLPTAANMNICDTAGNAATCTFTVTARTGNVALVAIIYDHDTKNTLTPDDDTFTPITWAYKTDIAVQPATNQTGIALAVIPATDLASVTVDFGTPPAALTTVAAIVGVEVGASGTMQLVPQFLTPASPTLLAPKISAVGGAKYRLTGIANNGTTATAANSAVLHRAQTSTTLAAGAWLGPPTGVTLTRTTASWDALTGAVVQGVEYDTDKTHHLLSITSFDGTTSATIPDLVALPTSGTLIGRATALQGSLDVHDFSIDDALTKITGFSAQPMQID